MLGYFYNEIGLKFETIDVKGCVEEGKFKPDDSKSSTSRVVTLDSLVDDKCIGGILTGSTASDKLDTLKAFWDPTAVTDDTNQFAARADLKLLSNLISSTVDDSASPPGATGRTIHQTSHINILPIDASQAWTALALPVHTDSVVDRNRAIIELLEKPFKDIRSHADEATAWQAYVQWYNDGKPEKDPIYFVQ